MFQSSAQDALSFFFNRKLTVKTDPWSQGYLMNNTIYYDERISDEARRQMLYDDNFLYTRLPPAPPHSFNSRDR